MSRSASSILPQTKDFHVGQLTEFRQDIAVHFVRLLNDDLPSKDDVIAYERVTSSVLTAIGDIARRVSYVLNNKDLDNPDTGSWTQLLGAWVWDGFTSSSETVSGQSSILRFVGGKYPSRVRWACMGALISFYESEGSWMRMQESQKATPKEVSAVMEVLKETDALCTERALLLFCRYVSRPAWQSIGEEAWAQGAVSVQSGIWNPFVAMVRSAGHSQTGEIFQPCSALGGKVIISSVLEKLEFYLTPSRAITLLHAVAVAIAANPSLDTNCAFDFYRKVWFTALKKAKQDDSDKIDDLAPAIFWPVKIVLAADGVETIPFPGHEKVRAVSRNRVSCVVDMLSEWLTGCEEAIGSNRFESTLEQIMKDKVVELSSADPDKLDIQAFSPLLVLLQRLSSECSASSVVDELFRFTVTSGVTSDGVGVKILRQLPPSTLDPVVEFDMHFNSLQLFLDQGFTGGPLGKDWCELIAVQCLRTIQSFGGDDGVDKCNAFWSDMLARVAGAMWTGPLPASGDDMFAQDRALAVRILISLSRIGAKAHQLPPKGASGGAKNRNPKGLQRFPALPKEIESVSRGRECLLQACEHGSTGDAAQLLAEIAMACLKQQPSHVAYPPWLYGLRTILMGELAYYPISFHESTLNALLDLVPRVPDVVSNVPWEDFFVLKKDDEAASAVQTKLIERTSEVLCRAALRGVKGSVPAFASFLDEIYPASDDKKAALCISLLNSSLSKQSDMVEGQSLPWSRVAYILSKYVSENVTQIVQRALPSWPPSPVEPSSGVYLRAVADFIALVARDKCPKQAVVKKQAWSNGADDKEAKKALLAREKSWVSVLLGDDLDAPCETSEAGMLLAFDLEVLDHAHHRWVSDHVGHHMLSLHSEAWPSWVGLELLKLVIKHPLRHLVTDTTKLPKPSSNMKVAPLNVVCFHSLATVRQIARNIINQRGNANGSANGSGATSADGVKSLRRIVEGLGDKLLAKAATLNEVEGVAQALIYDVLINVMPETPEIQRSFRAEFPRWGQHFTAGALVVRAALGVRMLPAAQRQWFLVDSDNKPASVTSSPELGPRDDSGLASAERAIQVALETNALDHLNAASRFAAVAYMKSFQPQGGDAPEVLQSLLGAAVPPKAGVVIPRHQHVEALGDSDDEMVEEQSMRFTSFDRKLMSAVAISFG